MWGYVVKPILERLTAPTEWQGPLLPLDADDPLLKDWTRE